MSILPRLFGLALSVIFLFASSIALAAPPDKCSPWPSCRDDGGGGGGGGTPSTGFSVISNKNWGELPVRKILQAFAYGGLATDAQISAWAAMSPEAAVVEMLTFNPVNLKLSPPGDGIDASNCSSLESLQNFWSGNDPQNVMKYADRYRYATLSSNGNLSTSNLQRTWTKAISTRGCNQFLHKMGLYFTNYHASISVHKTRAGMIRAYYDDVVAKLIEGGNFVDVATVAASHPAVARAYGHQYSRYYNGSDRFSGTDDFGREFHQLVFRIQGTTEDEAYHEDVTIEHTAWLLSGMEIDKVALAYGPNNFNTGDWYVPVIQYSDHYDSNGFFSLDPPIDTSDRYLKNYTYHYDSDLGQGSCLEILHELICGANSAEKIAALAPIAAAHQESMANVPVYMIDFFADDNLDQSKIDEIRAGWASANFDILAFIQAYAISTTFHNTSTFKFRTAFDRNLILQNANTLTNEEVFGREYYDSPVSRMAIQGAEVFEPAHDVFGGQTGFQAANNRYIFKDAFWANIDSRRFFDDFSDNYTLEAGEGAQVFTWTKDWKSVIPLNEDGNHVAGEVATWLWNHFIGDGGENFDAIARAQVQSFLSGIFDFGYRMDPENPDIAYSSNDISKKKGIGRDLNDANAAFVMNDLTPFDFNKRIGLSVNFISMLPYAFAMEGK
jgi:hypothetical protein